MFQLSGFYCKPKATLHQHLARASVVGLAGAATASCPTCAETPGP